MWKKKLEKRHCSSVCKSSYNYIIIIIVKKKTNCSHILRMIPHKRRSNVEYTSTRYTINNENKMHPDRNNTLYDEKKKKKRISFPRKNHSKKAFVCGDTFYPATVYLNIFLQPPSGRNWSILSCGTKHRENEGPSRRVSSRAAWCSCISQCSAAQCSATQREEGQHDGEQSACGSNRKKEKQRERGREREREMERGKKGTLCPASHALHTHEAYLRPSPRPYRPMTGMRSFY